MSAVLAVVAAYLVGAIPTGYLVGRAFGVSDIREHGSGNIGATNVLRTAGKVPAILTLLGDIAKGYAAVSLGALVSHDAAITAIGAFAAVAGNCWSVFLGFRGGKGVATALGAMLRLVPWATIPALVVWVALAATFRYSSLASLGATLCIPLGALLLARPLHDVLAAACVTALIVARHRQNISRLLAGTESRLGQRSAA